MPIYVVSYDLKLGHGSHDYDDLYGAFEKLASHKVLYSVYLVSTTSTAQQLKEYLSQYMDEKDRIWVSRLPPKSHTDYAYLAMAGTNDWLKKHPPS